jgi:hypothetical protein
MFTHQLEEKVQGRVTIPDLDSKALEALLEWMYSAKVPDFSDQALAGALLAAGEKYQMDEFKVLF